MASEQTYIMIKPDGVQRGLVGKIIQRFEDRGYQLVAMKLVHASEEHLEKHYQDLKGKPFFSGLVKYMASGPVVAMVWQGKDAVKQGRTILGATNPLASAPGTIRGDFAIDVGRNICHGSDSVDSAKAEIALWFGEQTATIEYKRSINEWIYDDIQDKVRTNVNVNVSFGTNAIFGFEHVVNASSKLVKAAQILDIPVLVTEQYPKASLRKEIDRANDHAIKSKTAFSMASNDLVLSMLQTATGTPRSYEDVEFILCGIETHVCLKHTAHELLASGAAVHIAQDGTSSCNRGEQRVALQTLRSVGAHVTTSESILFQLLGDFMHPKFKAISTSLDMLMDIIALCLLAA
ncbi:nucleoside-diphosphate kinase [Malassezia vespertilionis]|uniref:nucleoside-diphosphate kinase n=1 Tax=Malassezia vespertilionis TaxID=2020962 RepID=UPI0024B23B91|nr:nucleoside-diphosphate kinase [Malassezia vespertilionis]WFD06694.1 nucleoside-diphosphate kinase [Malassezia vespertilionis]